MPKYLEIAACEKRSNEWDAIRDIPDSENGVEEYDMRNLPMKGVSDNTYDGVYSEHFIEHLHKQEAEAFFVEMLPKSATVSNFSMSISFCSKSAAIE